MQSRSQSDTERQVGVSHLEASCLCSRRFYKRHALATFGARRCAAPRSALENAQELRAWPCLRAGLLPQLLLEKRNLYRALHMHSRGVMRSQCPFEALLAASGTLETRDASHSAAKAGAKATLEAVPSKLEHSSAGQSEQESEDDTAMRGSYAEGVGTSGGGDSGDNPFQSEDSAASQASEDMMGEVHDSRSRSGGSESSKSRTAAAAKKQRMVWTLELHKRFLNAVNHLGMENAVPKVILKMMNVDGITRENVASHLQKYRLHLRHQAGIQASKGNSKRQSQDSDSMQGDLRMPALLSPHIARGLPIPLAVPAGGRSNSRIPGGTALGLPLSRTLAPYQMAGSLIVGKPCEHIPPQAWAAGVPGYDALQKLAQIPEEQKASLLEDLTAPRPLPAELASCSRSRVPALETPALDIKPLTTSSPPSGKSV